MLAACTELEPGESDQNALMGDGGPGGFGGSEGGFSGTTASAGKGGGSGGRGGAAGGGGGSGGSGGDSSRAGMSGSDMSGQDDPLPADCENEGELRCAGSGSVAREICESGRWVATDSCADGEVCNSSSDVPAGSCSSLFELCVGHAGEAVCVGADMHFCNADSVSTHSESCDSERLCQAGLEAGACPLCLAETFHCEGRQLQKCSASGTEWEDVELCDTPELCNELSGACTAAACLPGDRTCSGDELQECRADQSGFESEQPCGAGLCDPVGKECDVCVPQSRICNDESDGYRQCTDSGQGYTDIACDPETPHCTGNGTCVQCTSPSHCDPMNQCKTPLCNSGTCGSTNRSGSCTLTGGGSGVCSGGSCLECTAASHCSASKPYCVANTCRPCNGPCAVGATCTQASDCASGVCTSGRCRPACSGSCSIGNQCAVAADCASNECTSGTCAKTCGTVTLTTMNDYNAARDCTRINGDLIISYNSAVRDPEFPYLTAITGSVGPTYSGGANPMTGLRLPAVRTIGGDVTLTATHVATVNWPELTTIGGALSCIQMLALTSFETPRLTSIGGPVQFTLDNQLTRIDMRALRTVDGYFNIIESPKINAAFFNSVQDVNGSCALAPLWFVSYSAVRPLWEASDRSAAPQQVGCCLAGVGVTTSNCGSLNVLSPECMQ